MLGQYLNIELSKKFEILTQHNKNAGNSADFNSIKLSITDYPKLEKVFQDFQPDVVIHTAAVSNPERADELPADKVYEINVNASQHLAELCEKYKAKMIYTSTDLVYAGYRGSMLKEDAKLIPVSLYAETKLMGEVKIKETFDNYLMLRVALQIGLGLNNTTNNFQKMYNNLKSKLPVKLYTDQFRTPLALHESARMIGELIEKDIRNEVINFSGSERVSRYELGEILCEEAGFDKNLLTPLTMEEARLVYKVADVSLNNEKLKSFGVVPKNLREMIREIINSRT